MRNLSSIIVIGSLCFIQQTISVQVLLNRVRQNIEKKAEQVVDKALGVDRSQPPANTSNAAGTSSGSDQVYRPGSGYQHRLGLGRFNHSASVSG
jgi:hypothetical protein